MEYLRILLDKLVAKIYSKTHQIAVYSIGSIILCPRNVMNCTKRIGPPSPKIKS